LPRRLLLGADCRIVYVESIARVRKLSLSGAILYHSRLADAFFVQWAELQARLPRSMYAGRLY
jgi:beta-1,4-N-acetylglucosaminyltransferase